MIRRPACWSVSAGCGKITSKILGYIPARAMNEHYTRSVENRVRPEIGLSGSGQLAAPAPLHSGAHKASPLRPIFTIAGALHRWRARAEPRAVAGRLALVK